jgi:hypothetical protein
MEEEIVSTPVQNPTLMELAINDSKNQQDQNSNNRDRDYPIRSHPVRRERSKVSNLRSKGVNLQGKSLPTGHAPKRLDARVYISFALLQSRSCMLDGLPLLVEVG